MIEELKKQIAEEVQCYPEGNGEFIHATIVGKCRCPNWQEANDLDAGYCRAEKLWEVANEGD